ncbi:YidB family protein [Roseomonas sp. CAU 1739]|uniref:YidB family protein n=1 Tax=Roseomonas sp. CAU 1739 TaxID=3140364 RepID=UPI00325BD7C4
MSDRTSDGGIGALLGALTGGRGGVEGLGDLVKRLRQGGLGEEVDSWVGSGENRDVAPERLANALGPDQLAVLAQHLGLSGGEAAGGGQGAAGGGMMAGILAQLLPLVVNWLTPQGRVPQSDAEYGAGGMGGLLAEMMGGAGQPQGGGGGGGIAGMLGALMGGGGGGSAGGLGALLGGLAGGDDGQAPSGKPGMGGTGPLPQKPRPLR